MNSRILLTITISFFWLSATSQSGSSFLRDAILFSTQKDFGSSRTKSIGNAGTAGSLDASLSFINPAALAQFRKGHIALTYGIVGSPISPSFYGNELSFSQVDQRINHVGLVFGINTPDDEDFPIESHSFSISLNKTGDFSNGIDFKGTNSQSGLSDFFIEGTNGMNSLTLDGSQSVYGLAFENFLFDVDPNQCSSYNCSQYRRIFPFQDLEQSGSITQVGNQYQWDVVYAVDFKGKLSAGAKLGLSTIRFEEEFEITEIQENQEAGGYSGTSWISSREVSGVGFNLGLGLKYEISENLEIGLGFSSGTRYSLTEKTQDQLKSSFNNFIWTNPFNPQIQDTVSNVNGSTILIENQNDLSIPLRLNFGAQYSFGIYHQLNFDLEYIPYSSISYEFENSNNEKFWNRYSGLLQNSLNFRLGYRLSLGKQDLSLGYRYYSDPVDSDNYGYFDQTFSLGFGSIDTEPESWFIYQFTMEYSPVDNSYFPYTLSGLASPEVQINGFSLGFFLSGTIFF